MQFIHNHIRESIQMSKVSLCGDFSWPGKERVTDRYGSFFVCECESKAAEDSVKLLKGNRVNVKAEVVSVQKCHHIGDLFHGFGHTVPEEGEIVDLGVGLLGIEKCDDVFAVVIKPDDGREDFWIDPMAMYRLCQQRVRVFIEETEEEFSAFPFWWSVDAKQEVPDWAKPLLKKEHK